MASKKQEEIVAVAAGAEDHSQQNDQDAVAAGQLESVRETRKRKSGTVGKKAKKRKLDQLLAWGIGEVGDHEDEGGMKDSNDIQSWLRKKESDVEGSKRLKQMELKFAKRFDKSYEKGGVEEKEKGVPFQDDTTNAKANDNGDTKKKRMTLKQLAAKNTKMTDWIRRQDNIGEIKEKERVDDEEDWPEMDQPEDIIRKETAKAKSMAFKIGHMCRGIVEELVDGVSSNSAAGMILESVLRRSWWRIRLTEVWRLLEDDRNLQKAILKKIERQEKDEDYLLEVVEKEEKLERRKDARER